MSLATPRCYDRNCAHFTGVRQDDGLEETERNVCRAFPDGIPDRIAYGTDLHLVPAPEQDNDTVYEEAT